MMYTGTMASTFKVARLRMSSTIRRRGLTSTSRPSGAWVAWTCFIMIFSSVDKKVPRSPLVICCRAPGAATSCLLSGIKAILLRFGLVVESSKRWLWWRAWFFIAILYKHEKWNKAKLNQLPCFSCGKLNSMNQRKS